jgi:hypothetical protein
VAVQRRRAVRSAGIHSAGNLIDFDHRAFWERRLLLVDVDREKLGRLYRNQLDGTRSRSPAMDGGRNRDQRYGNILVNGVVTIQELIDRYRG